MRATTAKTNHHQGSILADGSAPCILANAFMGGAFWESLDAIEIHLSQIENLAGGLPARMYDQWIFNF